MVGVNVPIPTPLAYHTFGGWKRSIFGDLNQHGPDAIRFYTKTKTVTSRWPSDGSDDAASFVMPRCHNRCDGVRADDAAGEQMMTRIAFIGLGNMADPWPPISRGPATTRAASIRWPLFATAPRRPALSRGFAREAMAGADVVITMLPAARMCCPFGATCCRMRFPRTPSQGTDDATRRALHRLLHHRHRQRAPGA